MEKGIVIVKQWGIVLVESLAGMTKEARAKRQARIVKRLKFKSKSKGTVCNLPKINEQVLARVEDALSLGCTQVEACLLANITPKILIDFKKDNPVWAEREKFLMNTQVRKAKGVISEALNNGDVNVARWYLEKKCRDEFGNQIKIDNTVTIKQAVVNWQKAIDTEFSEVKEVEPTETNLIEYSEEQEEDSGTNTN